MRARGWVAVVAAVILASGCCHHRCRCCGHRDRIPRGSLRTEELNPQAHEGPAAVLPAVGSPSPAGAKPTGAYGGS